MTTIAGLTDRQRQILALIAEGRSDAQIADCLGLANQTVRHHTRKIYAALGVDKRGNPRVAAALRWVRGAK